MAMTSRENDNNTFLTYFRGCTFVLRCGRIVLSAACLQVHYLKNPTDIQGTLNKLPFFMDAEKSMMQALIRGGPKAHVEALKAVPKNLQLMYL